MGKIQILDTKTINKIAAGEVVERPSSVVKELIENSIDAGATSISIEIKSGGITFIKVTDNGKGIQKDDVKIAFLSHTTSKLNKIEDLYNITSLGFRGEALASISAVSQIEMITKTHFEDGGTKLVINGGEISELKEYACIEGTSITVSNLFYNVPARRKFLKKASTECGYISDIINKIALGHPEISFKFINNEITILYTSGNNDLKQVIFNVYGKDITKSLVNIDINSKDYLYSLQGFICNPEITKSNRNYENIFINGRYIKSNIISKYIESAYKTHILNGKFPIYILNLKLSPSNVDINVHPNKLEVRFENEDILCNFIYNSIKNVLDDNILMSEKNISNENIKINQINNDKNILNNSNILEKKDYNYKLDVKNKVPKNDEYLFFNNKIKNINRSKNQSEIDKLLNNNINITKNLNFNENKSKYLTNTNNIKNKKFFNNYKLIGQIFNAYWIIEQNNSVFYIKQDYAYERILFEDIINKFKNDNITSKKLTIPDTFNICDNELKLINENINLFSKFGFEIDILDINSISIKSVPYIFKYPQKTQYFIDIIDTFCVSYKNNISKEDLYNKKIISIAKLICKAVIKSNGELDTEEINSIIYKFLELENPFYCIDNKSTITEFKKHDIEKLFKRV